MPLSLAVRAAGLGLTAAALSLSAAYAAPPAMVSANPARNTFTDFPKQIHLTFNEPVTAKDARLQLVDPDGHYIRLGTPVVSGDGLTVATNLVDPPIYGPYMLTWQTDSASGEAGKGDFTFFVKEPGEKIGA